MRALVVAVALYSLTAPPQCSSESVLVLGAGIAGLQAAAILRSQNISVTVLESRNEIGGRAMTKSFQGRSINVGPSVINPGAQWIHGALTAANPIWALATSSDCNVSLALFDFDHLVYYDSNKDGFNTNQDTNDADFDRLYDALEVIGEDSQSLAGVSLEEAFKDMWTANTSMRKAIEWFTVDFEHAANSSQIAADHIVVATYEVFSEENQLITDAEGVQKIPKCIAKRANLVQGQNLHLSERVKNIDYSGSNVAVTTATGKMYTADYVIVTFSVGVLQHQGLEFVPLLPELKQRALNKLRMGYYTTVHLKFENNFWSEKLRSVANSSTEVVNVLIGTLNQSRVYYYYNLAAFHDNWHTLAAVATGDLAAQIESQPKSKTRDQIMDLLREQFGDAAEDPTEIDVSIWLNDDNFYGSYSYPPVGLKESDIVESQASISGKLFFAGEALSEDYSGFMHGAYFSGEEVAKCVALKINPNSNFSCKIPDRSSAAATQSTSVWLMTAAIASFYLIIEKVN